MKGRHIFQLCLALLLCNPLLLKAQSTQTNYQYWIDDNKEEAVYETADGEDIDLSIDVSALSPGVHFYNMRAYETVGTKKKWGTTYRYLFCIPRSQQETADRLITGYTYAFEGNSPTVEVFDSPVEEYSLSEYLSVPQAPLPMVIDDDCSFMFDEDENTATLSRNINMSFTLYFKDQSGAICSPVTTDFVMVDELTESVQSIIPPDRVTIPSHEGGGFSVVSFEVEEDDDLKIEADGACSLRLYSPYSQLLDSYDADAMTSGNILREFEAGTYYAVVYGNTKQVKLFIGLLMVETPVITHQGDVVTITTATEGATIYYTLDGTTPTTESNVYTKSFTVQNPGTIKAIALREDYHDSEVATLAVDWLKVATPIFSNDAYTVFITTATDGATIYYTMDGTDPTRESAVYTDGFEVKEDCTVKAIAVCDGYVDSNVAKLVVDFSFIYAIYDSNEGLLTFKYGFKPEGVTVYEMGNTAFTTSSHPQWYQQKLNRVVIEEYVKDARPKSTAHWFCQGKDITEIVGLEYLNTSEVTNMEWMFNNCSSLTSLDLSNFDMSKVQDTNTMFSGCTSLTTINVGDGWTTDNVTNSNNMFSACTSLVGGEGTKFSSAYIDKTYARVDKGTSAPGYLTYKKTSDVLVGDVNSDGTVDISDYIGVANHILGNTPAGFDMDAADVNNDGEIDISDYIGVANIILTGKP